MPSDFARLISDIEREAREEGPQAVRDLEQFRKDFELAAARLATPMLIGLNRVPYRD